MRFVAFIYRNSKAYKPNASHIGLGVSALQHVIVLRRQGVSCNAFSCYEIDDTIAVLQEIPADSIVVIEAMWLVTSNVQRLLATFPTMHFVVRCHSQIGFLQVEPQAIQLFREQALYQDLDPRFELAGNSQRFSYFVNEGYNANCTYLPNLYDSQRVTTKTQIQQSDRVIRVGAFGALRNLKMHISGAAGAMLLCRWAGKHLELNISVGRDEHGSSVLSSLRNLTANLPWVVLVENPWADWPTFRRLIASMDICVQCSATETFNIVTADSLSEGVPCIVGPAIDWAPRDWVADIDDPEDVGSKLFSAYSDPRSAMRGPAALATYMKGAIATWMDYLGSFLETSGSRLVS